MTLRHLLIAHGLLNAILFSMTLPLWEGFDEPFHFGYAQHIALKGVPPKPPAALLSQEIAESLKFAPASHIVQRNLPYVTTYHDYFRLPHEEQVRRQHALRTIPGEFRRVDSSIQNYQAQQAPLAYYLLALPESLAARLPLPQRVLMLRLAASISAVLLLWFAVTELCRRLRLEAEHTNAVLFAVFSLQMTWATVAHVANDWLAVPLALSTLALTLRYIDEPNVKNIAFASGALALSLLTKEYALAFIPLLVVAAFVTRQIRHFAVGCAIVGIVAGPWYARNLHLYGAITGMQETRAGLRVSDLVAEASKADWMSLLDRSVRAAIWTGNNTFGSFSSATLTLLLITSTAGLVLWCVSTKQAHERIVAAYVVLGLTALAYNTLLARVFTSNPKALAGSWYTQLIVAPLFALAILGAARSKHWGAAITCVLVALSAYVAGSTYIAKLIPLYGGFEDRTTLAAVVRLYTQDLSSVTQQLDMTALGPAALIVWGSFVVACIGVALAVLIARRAVRPAAANN